MLTKAKVLLDFSKTFDFEKTIDLAKTEAKHRFNHDLNDHIYVLMFDDNSILTVCDKKLFAYMVDT